MTQLSRLILAASFFLGDRWPPQPNPYHELSQVLHASKELTLAVRCVEPRGARASSGQSMAGNETAFASL